MKVRGPPHYLAAKFCVSCCCCVAHPECVCRRTGITITIITAEIILFDGLVTVYRSSVDVTVYVSGAVDENELILYEVLNSLYSCFQEIVKYVFPSWVCALHAGAE